MNRTVVGCCCHNGLSSGSGISTGQRSIKWNNLQQENILLFSFKTLQLILNKIPFPDIFKLSIFHNNFLQVPQKAFFKKRTFCMKDVSAQYAHYKNEQLWKRSSINWFWKCSVKLNSNIFVNGLMFYLTLILLLYRFYSNCDLTECNPSVVPAVYWHVYIYIISTQTLIFHT